MGVTHNHPPPWLPAHTELSLAGRRVLRTTLSLLPRPFVRGYTMDFTSYPYQPITGTSRIVFFAGKIIYKKSFFVRSYFSEELFLANFPEPDTDRLEYHNGTYWRKKPLVAR